jgi:hypothetical protein
MKKLIILILGFSFLFSSLSRADEGMWLLSLIGKNYEEMKAMGFKLTPEDIYNVNQSCVKDAIVGLSREGSPFWHFCTGEIISPEGLMLTNHHCGFGAIQSHSTVEHDYLKDGFWALSKDQELYNEGITAEILVRLEDVSEKVLGTVSDDMDETDRKKAIQEISAAIVSEAEDGTHYKAQVIDMFQNNQYFLFVYEIFKDVRLVGAPPSAMGKFGGDTDNWMWPRHTADFSMFRIYTGPDGKPASFSEDNVPLKPRHFLPVNIQGVEEGDFAMILGFPGGTDRYMTSFELKETMEVTNANRYNIRTVKLDVLREYMNGSDEIRIKYASKYASCSNYWKYSNEQNKALRQLNTMGEKQAIEEQFVNWYKASPELKKKYGETLSIIEEAIKNRREMADARIFIIESLISGSEIPYFAYQMSRTLESIDKETSQEDLDKITERVSQFYKDFDLETEKSVMKALFEYYIENAPESHRPEFIETIQSKYKGDVDKFVEMMFKKSMFSSKENVLAYLEKPNAKKLEKDPAIITGKSILNKYFEINASYRESSANFDKGKRLWVNGLMKMNPDKNIYPDANSTIRLTYGTVGGYEPRDAVTYDYVTTINGVMEKEDPNSTEFIVPERLKELYNKKDFGQYADKNGDLITCFLTNNDITGGNSGSPVLNAEGHLIGIAFDGNSEAMSGDIDFEDNLQKCINVDMRYVLFIIDKYANAQNLINEMQIVK